MPDAMTGTAVLVLIVFACVVIWSFVLLLLPFYVLRIRNEAIKSNALLKNISDQLKRNASPSPSSSAHKQQRTLTEYRTKDKTKIYSTFDENAKPVTEFRPGVELLLGIKQYGWQQVYLPENTSVPIGWMKV